VPKSTEGLTVAPTIHSRGARERALPASEADVPAVSFQGLLPTLLVIWIGFLISLTPRPSAWLVVASGLPIVAGACWRAAQRRQVGLWALVRTYPDVVGLALVLLYALGVQMADTHGVTTDGVTYFAQLRSLVFDRDLDVAREFAFLNQPPRPNHVVPVGTLVLWAPLYLIVAAADALGRAVGWWAAPADPIGLGLGLPYVRAALLSSFAIGAAGLFALLLHLRTRFSRAVAFVSVLLVFGATPLYWYMVYEPSMTHAASFGFVALFVVCATRWLSPTPVPVKGREEDRQSRRSSIPSQPTPEERFSTLPITRRRALALGALLGLAFLARSQEALFALYPGLLLLTAVDLPRNQRVRAAVYLAGWAFVGALPWLLIQFLDGYALLTRYNYQITGQGGYLHLWESRWIDTLFSSWHGFLSWSPVAYAAVIGTFAYLRREWRWAASALLILFLTAWINGATQDWAGGWSFGGRRYSSALVMLAPGLAMVIEFALRRPLVALAPVVAAALWWNHLLMVQYTAGMLPKDEPVSFGRIVRQQAELQTRHPYWYPFAFPANVWFAWREGVPVDKYDVLSPETPKGAFSLPFDRVAERFLLSGWDVPGGDDWGSCWWIGGTPATIAVPLDLQAGDVTIRVRTRTRLEAPPVRAKMAVDVNGREVGTFVAGLPDATTSEVVIPSDVARTLFRRGFNQVGLRSLGVEEVDTADTREPTSQAARWRRSVWPVAVYQLDVRVH